MLGLFGASAQDKWNEWRDALEQLSQDIQALPDSPVRDDLQSTADTLYHNLMAVLPQIGSAAFEKAYCDAMATIAVKHIQVHHGVVQPEFGNEYSGLSGLGDTQDAPVTIPQQPMMLDYGVDTSGQQFASSMQTENTPPLDNIPSMKKVLCDNGSFIEVVDSMSDAEAKRRYCPKAAAAAAPGTDWLGLFTGLAKGAGRGVQSYYQIEAQNAALKAQAAQARQPKMPTVTGGSGSSHSNTTLWIIGGLALLVLGGGAAVLAGRSRSKKPS
jgi:hypothetical protein